MTVSKSKSNSELVPIGKVGRPHGLRGAFFVSDRDDLVPLAYGEIFIGTTAAQARSGKILASLWQSQRPVLKCDLSNDRTQAEALTHQTIFVDSTRIKHVTGPGVMFWRDLIGAEVRDVDGIFLGLIAQVYNTGASDNIEVRTPASAEGAGQGRRFVDIPMIADYVELATAFDPGPPPVLRLRVPGSFFDDLWQEIT